MIVGSYPTGVFFFIRVCLCHLLNKIFLSLNQHAWLYLDHHCTWALTFEIPILAVCRTLWLLHFTFNRYFSFLLHLRSILFSVLIYFFFYFLFNLRITVKFWVVALGHHRSVKFPFRLIYYESWRREEEKRRSRLFPGEHLMAIDD